MSRSMRPVVIQWGHAMSVMLPQEEFETMIAALVEDTDVVVTFEHDEAHKVVSMFTEDGKQFLDIIRDCNIAEADELFSTTQLGQEATACLENLKAMEPKWRHFIDGNELEVWIDV